MELSKRVQELDLEITKIKEQNEVEIQLFNTKLLERDNKI
jgi:hypothetical protein